MTELEASVRDQIALFVEGYSSADELNDRLPDLAELDDADDANTTELVMLVIGLLAEFQSGYQFESDLRNRLAEHAAWSIDRDALATGTTQTGLAVRVRAGAGTPLLAVHA
jgi:hypothetical protein